MHANMTTMFRIHEGVVPNYLREIIPNKLERISKCNPRTKSQYSIPRFELMVLISFFLYHILFETWDLIEARETYVISMISFLRLYLQPS